MTRQYVRKPASWAKRGPNARSNLGDEAKARALARSRAKHQIIPMIARPDGLLIDGYRTLWGLELEGMLDVELDFILTEENLTPADICVMQANSAMHREPISDFDRALAVNETVVANPGMTKKQMAEEVFNIDPSLVPRYVSLFDCLPEVQEAAKAGKIGVSDWYVISKSSDQLGTLRSKLGGATRDELQRQVRKQRDEGKPTVRTGKIRIDLPTGVTVTVSGAEISLEEAIEWLNQAAKEAKKARDMGYTAKTFSSAMRDRARAQ